MRRAAKRSAIVKYSPVSVFCTIAFPAFRSTAHAVWMFCVNQSMFDAQAVVSVFVLHVPHTIAFSTVRLFCACL